MAHVREFVGRHRSAVTIVTVILVLWVVIPVLGIAIYGMVTPK
jgi:hypothetical protein